ncbi:MAG: response regulator [Balneola sp.]
MNVLIVEDDKVLSLLLSKMIERLDYKVVGTYAKGSDAIKKAKELVPDLVLMDIMLEDDIDGIEATLEFQKSNKTSKVIYITGNSDSYNRDRANATEFVDYLVKPVSIDDLKSSINKIPFN